jgi:6-pyruvoyltetrahydropterin/6-carboxytetrahydropterin synthase
MHGHEWWLDVTISGPVSEEQGMIMDFSVLKETINACVVNTLDHSLINEQVFIPTAENMVIYIKDTIKDVLFYEYGVTLEKLRLYETSEAYVEWRP